MDSTLIEGAGEEDDLFKENLEPTHTDEELENVRLNLSQMDPRACKRPRVHWACSPLSKTLTPEEMAVEESSLLDNKTTEGDFLKKLLLQNNIANENKEVGKDLRLDLTGLLRSRSKNSSPASLPRNSPRHYISPALKKRYIASTAPSSDDTLINENSLIHTPVRRRPTSLLATPINPAVVDIEDIGNAIGSSFFSDTEVHNTTQPQETQTGTLLDDLYDFDFSLPKDEILQVAQEPLHSRFLVYTIEAEVDGAKLTGTNVKHQCIQTFHVRGEWLRCLPKQLPFIVHATFESCSVIDDASGYLVVFPDTLISATMVADSLTCSRRAVLSSRTQASVEDNKPSAALISGSIIHEIVEKSLTTKQYSADYLRQQIPAEIRKSLVDIFCADKDEATLTDQVQGLLNRFPAWAQDHLVEAPTTQELFISQVIKVEENIWSHAFGIKGKIDATVVVTDLVNGKTILSPFEMKTGHGTTSIAHRAQAIIYSFMIWDRYRINVEESLLFYIAKGELFRLRPSRVDLRSLLMARNNLALQITNSAALPPIIGNKHLCSKCFQLESCTLYHKVVESGIKATAPKLDYFDQRTLHLGSDVTSNSAFYTKWERLVQLEETEAINARQQLWTQSIEERKRHGNCISDLVLLDCVPAPEDEATTFAGFVCRFKSASNLLDPSQFSNGDPIVISASDQELFGLAIGYFKSADPASLVVVVDRPITDQSSMLSSILSRYIQPVSIFRIDKDELVSGFGLLRTNLLKLAAPECQRLMQLVVKLQPPTFVNYAGQLPDNLLVEYESLDDCQKQAVQRVLSTRDYLLILGMPGTGKSTTLVFVIRLLVHLGKTILLSSHTHTAIDNVLMKLMKLCPESNFVRLGNPAKITKALQGHVLEAQKFESIAQLDAFYMRASLVACTCLGANHALLQKRIFDICIMDEASQISVPASLGPLRRASSFILVGDHYQLPPLVKSKVAQSEGLNQSLFSILASEHPSAVTILSLQYRMNADIMSISNRFVYGGMLTCGSEAVSNSKLYLPKTGHTRCVKGCDNCWLSQALCPNNSVLFLDTDQCKAQETPSGKSYSNQFEASLVLSILNDMYIAGADTSELSVISPYRPQLKLITDNPDYHDQVQTSTVDKFQGLDSDCIIISLVRSNLDNNIGQLLRDWNRLNVAFTRARKKLILIGSARTIMQHDVFKQLHDLFKERGWLYQLPYDALSHQLIHR